MIFIQSTIDEPIGFFEDYFHKNGFQNHYQEFIDQCTKAEIKSPATVKFFIIDGDCIIHQIGSSYSVDDSGLFPDVKNEFILTDSFSNDVEKLLKSEFEKSKILLKKNSNIYLLKHNDNSKFLNFQKVLLDEIIQDSSELIKEFPYCVDHLKELSQYIQDLSLNGSTIKEESNPKSVSLKTNDEAEDIFDPINEILGYLNGNNDNNQKIMSKTDFDTLIDLIEKVKNNEVVLIEKKLDIKVPVVVLRYTFYVLHLYLFGNKKNEFFIQSLLDAILTFKEWELSNFKSKLSEPPSKFPTYIPQIIRDQRQKQK